MTSAPILILTIDLVSSVSLISFSPFPRSAQSARPERGQLPHHSPTPPESYSLREPHCTAGPQLHLTVHLSQPPLHPQQLVTASAH